MNPFATATELLADLRAGRVTASELAEMYIGRIEQHDGRLNAVVERDFERARAAGAARRIGARGMGRLRGPADHAQGIVQRERAAHDVRRAGVEGLRLEARRPGVGAHLRAAGAVLLGKTNVPPMLADWQSANAIYGRTNNPWDVGLHAGRQQRRQRGRDRRRD